MRSKVYKNIFAALLGLSVFVAANAQSVAPVPAVPAVPPVAEVAPVPPAANVFVVNRRDKDSQAQDDDATEKSKTFSKSYALDANDEIRIENSFGKINVNTWDKNEVKVDVAIKASANDEAETQKILDQTVINSSKNGNIVSFKTEINKGLGWWGTLVKNSTSKRHKVEINYTVYMPAKTALTITNKFGATTLPDLDGKLDITNAYGALNAKSLSNRGNVINVAFGSANIGSVYGSKLKVAYGGLTLNEADKLDATVSYGHIKISKLSSSGNIILKYGSLDVDNVSNNLKTLDVTSSFSPIKLGLPGAIDADFDVTTSFGSFSYNNDVNVTSKVPDKERGFSTTKSYKGHLGKGGSDKMIVIKSSYGSVKFD